MLAYIFSSYFLKKVVAKQFKNKAEIIGIYQPSTDNYLFSHPPLIFAPFKINFIYFITVKLLLIYFV